STGGQASPGHHGHPGPPFRAVGQRWTKHRHAPGAPRWQCQEPRSRRRGLPPCRKGDSHGLHRPRGRWRRRQAPPCTIGWNYRYPAPVPSVFPFLESGLIPIHIDDMNLGAAERKKFTLLTATFLVNDDVIEMIDRGHTKDTG